MSEAENLLNTLSSDDIALYTVNPETEEHIIIDDRRIITVPEPLKRIAVQYDHNIETVTFDCPRYWDNNDLSKMYIYINYRRADNDRGRYLTKNVRIDEEDSNIIHFDWTIGNEITVVNGALSFLVCAVKTDSEGNEEIHWNTELNNQMNISNGLECEDAVLEKYPDVINDIFTRLDTVISDNSEITANNATIIANNAKITANAENLISTSTELTKAADAAVASHDELAAKLTYIENNMEEVVGEVAEESFTRVTADLSNEFYRVKDDILETGEASGSYITLNDSAMAQMQELEVNSVEKQVTTQGYNLWNFNVNQATKVKVNDDGTITINGNGGFTIYIDPITLKAGKNYYETFELLSGSITGSETIFLSSSPDVWMINKTPVSYTMTEDKERTGIWVDAAATFNNATIKLWITEGEKKDFEPYTGGTASPNPDYPQEIPVLQGTNLFDKDNENMFLNGGIVPDNSGLITSATTDITASNYIRTIIIPCKSNTTYTLSRYIPGKTFYVYDSEEYPTLNYQMRFIKSNTSNGEIIETITTSSNAHYILLKIYNTYASEINTYDEVIAKIQIEEGSVATPYIPYGYVRLKTIGKNLFDKDNITLQYRLGSDGLPFLDKNYFLSDFIKVKPNTIYICSALRTATQSQCICLYDKNFKFITRLHFNADKKYKLTTDDNTYYVRITDNIERLEDTQLEEGSVATEYEPYQESILNIPIPEGEFVGYINDDVKDILRVDYNEEDGAYHLYLDKVLRKVVLNGSENIINNPNGTNSYNVDIGKLYKRNPNLVTLMCSHFKAVSYNNRTLNENNICFLDNNSTTYQLTFRNTTFTTVDEFKTWLSNNNVTVCYELANPYTLDLGIVDMPLSYDGVTNIFVDTDLLMNINTKYYRNFTETIRNLQINNDTLKNELASIESRLSALEAAQANESGVEE